VAYKRFGNNREGKA